MLEGSSTWQVGFTTPSKRHGGRVNHWVTVVARSMFDAIEVIAARHDDAVLISAKKSSSGDILLAPRWTDSIMNQWSAPSATEAAK